jgi:hypothetical protein
MSAERVEADAEIFREVNERLLALSGHAGDDDRPLPFLCECADLACTEEIDLTYVEYRALRAHPLRYAVVLGHEGPGDERIDANDRFAIIERVGEEAARRA